MDFLTSLFECFFSVFNFLVSSDSFIILMASAFIIGAAGIIQRLIRSE